MPCKFHANSTQIPCKFHANIMCLPLSPAQVSNPSSCSPESRFQPPTVFLVHFELVTSLESGGNQHSSLPPFGSRTRGLVEGCVACRSLQPIQHQPRKRFQPPTVLLFMQSLLVNAMQIPRKFHANPTQIPCKFHANIMCLPLSPAEVSNPSSCSPESRFQPPTVFLVHFELVTSLESGGNQHSSLPPFGSRTRGLVEGCVACRSLQPIQHQPRKRFQPPTVLLFMQSLLVNAMQIPRKFHANPTQIPCKFHANIMCLPLSPAQVSNPSSCSPESRFQPPTVFLVHFELVTSLESGGNQHSSLPPFGSRTRGLVEGCVACRSLQPIQHQPRKRFQPPTVLLFMQSLLVNAMQIPRKFHANPTQIPCKFHANIMCLPLSPAQVSNPSSCSPESRFQPPTVFLVHFELVTSLESGGNQHSSLPPFGSRTRGLVEGCVACRSLQPIQHQPRKRFQPPTVLLFMQSLLVNAMQIPRKSYANPMQISCKYNVLAFVPCRSLQPIQLLPREQIPASYCVPGSF